MKKKIYTSMLFGISVAFSVAGHTQTKPINKSTAARTVHTATVQSKHTKTVNKKSIAAAVKSTPNSKKTAGISKSANKKNAITPNKTATAKKSITKKQAVVSTKLKNKKHTVAAKSARNNKALIATKSKHNKQAIASAKLKHTSHPAIAFEPARRQHIFIASKSLQPALSHKERQKHVPAELNLGNTRTDQIIQPNNDKQSHPITFDRSQTTKTNTAHVSIETSLFLDGLEAGLSKELILQLTDIFAWDIDFATNLRPGDQFTIVYGKKIVNGTETDSDEIIAAEFVNQGASYTAIRYIDESGTTSYYSPDGQSMQRAFLSTPVDFIKISSHFDMHRKHPILNRIRAHKGIDYAARTGTPIKTTGDGIVTFSGRKGAYGQVVIIQHNDHYETLYAHMSGFKKGLTAGNHVKQGDVIGYVGQSGLATGPHLHYEFHVDGLYRDPETVKIPHSMPISSALLTDFKAQTQPFYAQLNQTKAKSLFAKNQETIAPDIALPPASIRSSRYD